MTVGTLVSQGTELFVVDNVTVSDDALIKLACPTGITGLGGTRDQVEDTCLDTIGDKTFKAGLGNPGTVTVPFNLIPTEVSHQRLFLLKESGTVLKWIVCMSESTTDPTLSAGVIVPPTSRTSIRFDAFVSDVNIDIATNAIVTGTLTLQRSGSVTFTPRTT